MSNRTFVNGIQILGSIMALVASVGCGRAGCASRGSGPDASDLGVPTDEGDQERVYSDDGSNPDATEEPDRRVAYDWGTPKPEKDCGFFPKYDPCDGDLPEPDTPCDREGEIRCTNEGALPRGPNDYPYCYRPYYVRCEKGEDGQLKWVIHEVPQSLADFDYRNPTCQENARGVHFCPGEWLDGSLIEYEQLLCDPRLHGIIYCIHGSEFFNTCDFADNIEDENIRKIRIEPVLERCPTCANCLYRWPTKRCPYGTTVAFCTYEEYRSGVWDHPGKCIVEDNCEIRCAETWYDFCVR